MLLTQAANSRRFQYLHYPVHRRSAILVQQELLLRLDGRHEAALWPCHNNHDPLVGSRQDGRQWR